MDRVSALYTGPLAQWIVKGKVIKFFGDNVNKKRKRRDERSSNKSEMLNMYSVLTTTSRTPTHSLSYTGTIHRVSELSTSSFLPSKSDIEAVQANLVVIVSRVLTQYITGLSSLSKSIEKHIRHKYSKEMSKKS